MDLLLNFHFSVWGLFLASGFFVFLPYFFAIPRNRGTRLFTALASGALIGIFLFDLLPFFLKDLSVGEISLLSLCLPVFYFLHKRYHRHHSGHGHHDPSTCQDSSWDPVFWTFIIAHSFLDGFFLRLSFRYSPYLVQLSFFSIFIHRASEALFLSTLSSSAKRHSRLTLFAYLFSFPAGAYVVNLLFSQPALLGLSTHSLATMGSTLMSLTLLGLLICLIFDSVVPALRPKQGRRDRWQIACLALGFLIAFGSFQLKF